MPAKRVILELGTGNDLHGGDYTKAALRAVQDALHHSSLAMIRSLKIDSKTQMFVNVTIGVQQPDKVDVERVRASLPHGIVTVKAVKGGLDVPDPEGNDIAEHGLEIARDRNLLHGVGDGAVLDPEAARAARVIPRHAVDPLPHELGHEQPGADAAQECRLLE